jgi:hypothetical protein
VVRWPDVIGVLPDASALFLPHPTLVKPYDPEAVVRVAFEAEWKTKGIVVFGHLNASGILMSGSESDEMARGREYYWPLHVIPKAPHIVCVGGHIHRAQLFEPEKGAALHIVGSPVRFTFGEADHTPARCILEFEGGAWNVIREPVPANANLRRFHTIGKGMKKPSAGDFVRGDADPTGKIVPQIEALGAKFVKLPSIVPPAPAAEVSTPAKHRRVREVVTTIANSYGDEVTALADQTMSEVGL